jgi:expansin (peptidoglycan-binding protein)
MLFNDVYERLSSKPSDLMPVEWDITSCQHHEPLVVRFAEGANPWWVSLQIINHNYPVLDVWLRPAQGRMDDDDGWSKMEGKRYNYFTTNQLLRKMDVKVLCSNQLYVLIRDVTIGSGAVISADRNC